MNLLDIILTLDENTFRIKIFQENRRRKIARIKEYKKKL